MSDIITGEPPSPVPDPATEAMRKAVVALTATVDGDILKRMLVVIGNGSTAQPATNGHEQPATPALAPAKKVRGPYKKDPHSLHSLHRHVLTTVPMPLGASIESITSTLNKSGRMPIDWNQDDSTKILTRSPHVFQRLHNGNWILKKIASKHLPLIDPIK